MLVLSDVMDVPRKVAYTAVTCARMLGKYTPIVWDQVGICRFTGVVIMAFTDFLYSRSNCLLQQGSPR